MDTDNKVTPAGKTCWKTDSPKLFRDRCFLTVTMSSLLAKLFIQYQKNITINEINVHLNDIMF